MLVQCKSIKVQNNQCFQFLVLFIFWEDQFLIQTQTVRESNCGPLTIFPSQWHSCDSNSWPWLWYRLSELELCYFTSKLISDEENTLKSFMIFDIKLCTPVFRVVVGSRTVVPKQLALALVLLTLEATSSPSGVMLIF